MEHEKQNGISPHNPPGTPKRSRSPSPSAGITWKVKNPKMPKHSKLGRQYKVFGSLSEDDNGDSAVSSPVQLDDQVFGPPPPSPSHKTEHHRATLHKTNSYGTIEEGLDTGVLKKRLSSLFKSAKTSGFKRQDSDLGYHSQGSPLSPLPNQHGFNGHVTNGLSNGGIHRDLSIEEELENRLIEVSEVAKQWKTRWRQERDVNHQLQEQFTSCERECYLIIDNVQETYEEYIADVEIKLEKSADQQKQLHVQKSQAETELRKVINGANKESTKFKQELESVQTEVASLSDHMKNLKETNRRLEAEVEEKTQENEKIRRELTDKTAETEKLQKELSEEKSKVSDGLKVAAYDQQSKIKTVEMQTELYKSLLDTALNKLKLLEEHVSMAGDDVRRRSSTGTDDASRRRLSSSNDDVMRRPFSRGRYILRVNSLDPTDMFLEDSVTSGHNNDVDAESVSSEGLPSSSKRTSVCSSVNMSEIMGSETNLPSLSSLGSSMRGDEEVFGDGDAPDGAGVETYTTQSLPRRKRASSEGGPSESVDSSLSTSTLERPTRRRAATYSTIESPTGYKASMRQLIKSSSESITGLRPSSRSSRNRGSVNSRTGSVESETSGLTLEKPEETTTTKSSRITTLREIKRKRSDSYKASFPSESTLQKLHKYRSVGDLIKGITGEKTRRSSREEAPPQAQDPNHSPQDQNINTNNREKVVPPLIKSRTMNVDNMQPKLLKAMNSRTSYDVLPSSSDKKSAMTLSRQPSDVSTSSYDVKLFKSSSTDDVAGTRTSGFGALRSRRNGLIADPGDFKDISKQLRKKHKGGGRDFSDILKRLSRGDSDETKDDAAGDYKPHRRRSKNK